MKYAETIFILDTIEAPIRLLAILIPPKVPLDSSTLNQDSHPTLLKMVAQQCVSIGTIANLLSSILTILLTCPNNDTVLCYSNDSFLTVKDVVGEEGVLFGRFRQIGVSLAFATTV